MKLNYLNKIKLSVTQMSNYIFCTFKINKRVRIEDRNYINSIGTTDYIHAIKNRIFYFVLFWFDMHTPNSKYCEIQCVETKDLQELCECVHVSMEGALKYKFQYRDTQNWLAKNVYDPDGDMYQTIIFTLFNIKKTTFGEEDKIFYVCLAVRTTVNECIFFDMANEMDKIKNTLF